MSFISKTKPGTLVVEAVVIRADGTREDCGVIARLDINQRPTPSQDEAEDKTNG